MEKIVPAYYLPIYVCRTASWITETKTSVRMHTLRKDEKKSQDGTPCLKQTKHMNLPEFILFENTARCVKTPL